MKHIYLIRHAQSESNAGVAIRPNSQINITNYGKTQAEQLANWLLSNIDKPVNGVFISPYIRTAQTAEPYLTQTKQQATVIDDLYEFNYFDFEHIKELTFTQLVTKADNYWQTEDIDFQDSENTDSYRQFIQRVRNVRQLFQQLPDGCYVIFTHGMWIGMLLWQLLHNDSKRIENMHKFRDFELSIRPKNCEVFLLKINDIETVRKIRSRQDSASD